MGRSSGTGDVPVVDYPRSPDGLDVTVQHRRGVSDVRDLPPAGAPVGTPHAHDFLLLLLVEAGAGALRVDGRDVPLAAGDVAVLAPGAVVAPHAGHLATQSDLWMVYFPADVVDPGTTGSLVSWRSHPLLAPLVGHGRGGWQRFTLPDDERDRWVGHVRALDTELRERREGAAAAVRAYLTLLLVGLTRLEAVVTDELRDRDEPLLAAVFDVVEQRFRAPLSLRDVADAVGLTPGHVTTVVRRRTGRTVQQWITERRLREARRLLADTDLTVTAVAARVGFRDAGYFVRRFRAEHGVPPGRWRGA
ncbi:AraC family transcriptional regulator [Actinomycetospora straminea]|uniref:AraC family transcriptional regulator n=1 Tax=Actinomycetospora straminea TaxID=663607 RepID=A0ABP9DRB6_9PSEU|nr:AraC family transcriptional regulator [Actinomycetospora straminea]MDD7936252.1 AraC family transcriptional regulator [Actinomycetospora straminea]